MNRGLLIAAACLTDAALGDPHAFPHPVRVMGDAVVSSERFARRFTYDDSVRELLLGGLVTAAIIAGSSASAAAAVALAKRADARVAAVCEIALAWTTIASRDLLAEAGRVIAALSAGDVARARVQVARIVGRDTADLDESEIVRATIETLAESACDGIVGPVCALVLGGVPAAFAFKAISTLDSMIGHIEAPYTWFGRVAARLDDAACWLPARFTAAAIVLVAPFVGGSARAAWRTWSADGSRHRSPNAGRPEAAMAGALGVRLGGANRYDGVTVEAALLGATFRRPTVADARRARDLVAAVAVLSGLTTAGLAWLRDRP